MRQAASEQYTPRRQARLQHGACRWWLRLAGLVDLVEDAAVIEELRLRGFPAAEIRIDGHQLQVRELLAEVLGDRLITRAVEVLGGQALTFIAVQVVEVGLGYLAGALAVDVGIHHAHRRLGKDRQRRGNDLEVVTALFLQRQEGFVFPGQQHIADAVVDEGDGRATRSAVEYWNVLVQLGDELLGLRFAAVLLLGKGPGGQQVPARAAGGFRVRRDHFYARL